MSTSAPPVACNLPPEPLHPELINLSPQPVTASYSGNGSSEEISDLWLSQEQADRIYRGRR